MKELEGESFRLKKMYAEESLKADIITEAIEKKVVKTSNRKMLAKAEIQRNNVSISQHAVHSLTAKWGFGLCFLYLRNLKGSP